MKDKYPRCDYCNQETLFIYPLNPYSDHRLCWKCLVREKEREEDKRDV